MTNSSQLRNQDEAPEQLKRVSSYAPFASVLETFQAADHATLNPRLKEAIYQMRGLEPGVKSSNRLGWHSPRDLFDRDDPAIRAVCGLIKTAVVQYIRRYWTDFPPDKRVVSECWANINEKGAFNAPHAHSEFHVSGCYYVAVPEASEEWSGSIEFHNPMGAIQPFMKVGNRLSPPSHRLRPQAGQMLLFPAYLKHWVYPNQEAEDRISLAFNFAVIE